MASVTLCLGGWMPCKVYTLAATQSHLVNVAQHLFGAPAAVLIENLEAPNPGLPIRVYSATLNILLCFFVKLSSILQENLIRMYSALNTLW